MKLFKNGISVKWLLLVVGIVIGIGLVVASVEPIISNTHSYLDILHVNYIHGDGTNLTGKANTTLYNNFTAGQNFTVTNTTSAGITVPGLPNTVKYLSKYEGGGLQGLLIGYESTGSRGTVLKYYGAVNALSVYNNTNREVIFISNTGQQYWDYVPSAGSSYAALCYDESGKGLYKNPGLQTCTVSDMRLKENISIVTINTAIRNKFVNIELIKYQEPNDPAHRWRFGINSTKLGQDFPMLVSFDGGGNAVGIHYELLSVLNTLIIQDQVNQLYDQQLQLNIFNTKLSKICSNQPSLCS